MVTTHMEEKGVVATHSKTAIVVVDYNGLEDTARCLESLEQVNYNNFIVYLVDNGGNNSSELELLCSKYDRVVYVRSDVNLGFSGGNNLVLSCLDASFDYVLLLNNDTVVTRDFLDRLLSDANEDTLVGSKIYYWKDKERIWYAGGVASRLLCKSWQSGYRKLDKDYSDPGPCDVSFVSGCCLLIPRKCIDTIGLLDDSYFLYYEDTDYCLRALDAGFKLYYEPNSVIYHCVSASAGHDSPLRNYYMIRNRQIFIDRFSTNRFIAKSLAFLEVFVGVLIGKYQYQIAKRALFDYRNGIDGRMNTNS